MPKKVAIRPQINQTTTHILIFVVVALICSSLYLLSERTAEQLSTRSISMCFVVFFIKIENFSCT